MKVHIVTVDRFKSNSVVGSNRRVSGQVLSVLLGAALITTVGSRPCAAQSPTPEVWERAKSATVLVLTKHSKNQEGDTDYGSGTGFFVNSTGLAVTNNHVVDPGHKKPPREKHRLIMEMGRLVWTIVTDSGTADEQERSSKVLYQNEKADLAILQVRDEDGEFLDTPDYLRFFPTAEVTRELKAWCLGFPGGDRRKGSEGKHAAVAVTSGNVVDVPRTASGRVTMIATDVLANPGNSGGPFIDAAGRLVGVLTLAGQTEARTNDTKLIPGDLVQEMIRSAFKRGKVPGGVDLKPFYDLFVGKDRIWDVPGYERLNDRDCLVMAGGGRLCGSASDSTVTWPSPLGNIEVPTSWMAYVLMDEKADYAMAFMDGGDRFPVNSDDAVLKFTPTGGESRIINLYDLAAISFRKPSAKPKVPDGPVSVISGNDYRLSLAELSGEVAFETELGGTIRIPASEIEGIGEEDGDRVLFTGGSRVPGSFEEHELSAKLAWSGTPIRFTLSEIESAVVIQSVDYSQRTVSSEIGLAESLKTSDPRLVEIAGIIGTGDVKSAGPLLEQLLEHDTLRSFSKEKKEQIRSLHGEFLLRSGKYSEAAGVFRKLRRAKQDDVLWHARSRLAILDRYQDGQFGSEFISRSDVFKRAGKKLAADYVRQGKLELEEIEGKSAETRGEYLKLVKRSRNAEEQLLIANRLTGGATEELVVRLWRALGNLHRSETERLAREREEIQGQQRGSRGRSSDYRQRQVEQKLSRIDRYVESAQEALEEVQEKLDRAGFIIDDPDRAVGDEEYDD